MLLYILDPITFDRYAVVEAYESCIWTERFIEAGDFTLVMAQADTHADLIRGGTLLENEESDWPMIVEGIAAEEGSLTITGRTLETFFNQISLSPTDYVGEDPFPDYQRNGTPGEVLNFFVNLLQDSYYGVPTFPGFLISTTVLASADGAVVDGKINDRELGHDLLVRMAKEFNVDMYVKRVEDTSSELNGPGTYKFAFGTRAPVDHSKTNPTSGGDPELQVRFSPEDDNLIGVREAYDVTSDVTAMIVHVPEHFTRSIGEDLGPVLYGFKASAGVNAVLDSLADLNKPPLEIRLKEADSEKITADYLRAQIWRYYPGENKNYWSTLTWAEKTDLLQAEMERLAIVAFESAKKRRGHVIDGEVVANTFKYNHDYKLGDKVDVSSGLTSNIPYSVNEKIVSEFIRSLDDSGYRSYPTLAPPTILARYSDSSYEVDYPHATYVDHTYSINGILPSSLGILAPHKIKTKSGQTKQLVSISQTGPVAGTCTVVFLVNGDSISSGDLPITFADGDTITVDVSTHSSDAKDVSGHFTIRVKG